MGIPGYLGSGTGVLGAVQPAPRLLAGGLALVACTAAPGSSLAGIAFIALVVLATVWAAGVNGRLARRVVGYGLVLYVPLLVIVLVGALFTGSHSPGQAMATSGVIAIKAMATLSITLAVVSTLRTTQLYQGLGRLPMPDWVKLLLLQIVHQAGCMLDETMRIRQAVAVRGAGGSGGYSWELAKGLPVVWLERMAARAGRISAAMEVRGYASHSPDPFPRPGQWAYPDVAALGGGAAALILALSLHVLL